MKKELLEMDLKDLPVGDSIDVGDMIVTDFGAGPVDVEVISIVKISRAKSGIIAFLEVAYEESVVKPKNGKIVCFSKH